jgi:adenylosuccinate synthase
MINKIVIGVGYGDEGKGATVNHLATPDSTVVRFNGGCQAGHTVVENGIRHVFSSFGSGPFLEELKALKKLGTKPKITINPLCDVTLPIDVAINQDLEDKKNKEDKHGSVGVGFGETIERSSEYASLSVLSIKECQDRTGLKTVINEIYDRWLPHRCSQLNLDESSIRERYDLDNFIDDCLESTNYFTCTSDRQIFEKPNLIFEGAQGLGLDPSYGVMPYCTRSSCGLNGIPDIIKKKKADIYYVSRPYLTRHGAGPLEHEEKMPDWVIDHTNIYSQYQGSLLVVTNFVIIISDKYME